MINLLPNIAKKRIVTEYWMRVISVWLLILGMVGLVISLLFIPTYVLVDSQIEAYEAYSEKVLEKVAEYDLSASTLTKVNTQAQSLLELKNIDQFSDLVTKLESIKDSNVSINEFEFKRQGLKVDTLQLRGFADTRQSLAEFRDSLLILANVKDVDLPISNLAKDRDIMFSITIKFNNVN